MRCLELLPLLLTMTTFSVVDAARLPMPERIQVPGTFQPQSTSPPIHLTKKWKPKDFGPVPTKEAFPW